MSDAWFLVAFLSVEMQKDEGNEYTYLQEPFYSF